MATSISELRHALKNAPVGTGKIKDLILGCDFNIGMSGFTTLIATCGKRGHVEKAREIFDAMHDRGIRPNAITYTSLISVFSAAGKCEEALELFKCMKADSINNADCRPDQVVYRSLIPAFAKAGLHGKVFQLFAEMDASLFEPDRSICIALVLSSLECRELDQAITILNDMHAKGMAATPREYAGIITACCAVGDWDYAVEAFLTMQAFEVEIDSEVCGALLFGSEACGRPDMGMHLVSEMESSKIEVTLDMYNSLLRSLSNRGMWQECLRVFRRMERRGVQINRETAAAVVDSCLNGGKRDLAFSLAAKFKVTMKICIDSPRSAKKVMSHRRGSGYYRDDTTKSTRGWLTKSDSLISSVHSDDTAAEFSP